MRGGAPLRDQSRGTASESLGGAGYGVLPQMRGLARGSVPRPPGHLSCSHFRIPSKRRGWPGCECGGQTPAAPLRFSSAQLCFEQTLFPAAPWDPPPQPRFVALNLGC